jgi:hypothetical protein
VGKLNYDPNTGAPSLAASCEAPRTPIPEAFYAEILVPEPNLPYPGRTTPFVSPGSPYTPRGTMTAATGDDDGGCSATGRAPGFGAWMFLALGGLMPSLRRGRGRRQG